MRPDELERRLRERLDALGPAPRAELLHVLMLPDFERFASVRSALELITSRTKTLLTQRQPQEPQFPGTIPPGGSNEQTGSSLVLGLSPGWASGGSRFLGIE
jgi:hypothetical protein